MSSTAYYHVISEKELNEALNIPKEEFGRFIRDAARRSKKSLDAHIWGNELYTLISECQPAMVLMKLESIEPSELRDLFWSEFGVGTGGFYGLWETERVAGRLETTEIVDDNPDSLGWSNAISHVLERHQFQSTVEELVELMLSITRLFVYARDNNCVVIYFWA